MGNAPVVARVDWEWQRQFVSDVYHTLAQPLTALHCLLELALRTQPDVDQQRSALQEGLKLTSEIIGATRFVRRLAEADDPGQSLSVPLGWAIHVATEELGPVAESMGSRIEMARNCTVRVWMDPTRLREVLFHLLDWVLQSAHGSNVCVDVQANPQSSGEWATVSISPAAWTGNGKTMIAADLSRNLGIAQRMVKAAHGELAAQSTEAGTGFILRLPLTAR
jgi:signal transduction histidine kinase